MRKSVVLAGDKIFYCARALDKIARFADARTSSQTGHSHAPINCKITTMDLKFAAAEFSVLRLPVALHPFASLKGRKAAGEGCRSAAAHVAKHHLCVAKQHAR